jgi:arabinogalactan endo-1,4-beta-galactosidase
MIVRSSALILGFVVLEIVASPGLVLDWKQDPAKLAGKRVGLCLYLPANSSGDQPLLGTSCSGRDGISQQPKEPIGDVPAVGHGDELRNRGLRQSAGDKPEKSSRFQALASSGEGLGQPRLSTIVGSAPPGITPREQSDPAARKDPAILGADISWVQEREARGIRYSDQGAQKDILEILKDHQFNWIRLRIFHDPKAPRGYSAQGYCDRAHTLAMGRRIKVAGMKFLLDFHYSDTWADPGKQFKPSAWKDLHGADLEKAVKDYTREVVAKFKAEGTSPDMIQIGNEINHGILWPDGATSQSLDPLCGLLKAGIAGAKEADPSVKIMLHLACGGQNAESRRFLDRVTSQGVAFDVIGQSYYPRWHGTLDDLRSNLTDLAKRYEQPIILVEYSVPDVKPINDIVHQLPAGKGLGTFIWEPTGGALFDSRGAAKAEIDVFPELAKDYAEKKPTEGRSSD